MECWRGPLDGPSSLAGSVVTLGNFDGVHTGHRGVLQLAVRTAHAQGLPAVVVTFDPHPTTVVAPERRPKLLTTLAQKQAVFQQLGLDVAWVIPFSRAFSELEPEDFLDALARRCAPVALHVGQGFRFGRDRRGDLAVLQAWGQRHGCLVQGHAFRAPDGGPLSSSRVRAALDDGDVALAAALLGEPYALTGPVVDGDRRGRHLGFPTANLAWEQEQLPAWGVYVTEVRGGRLDGPRMGMTNIGEKPTFQGKRLTVETFIPDFEGDLYGSHLEIAFLHRLRGEQRFPDLEALQRQISQDVADGRAWWANR